MSKQGKATTPIWTMLEELYLDSANQQAKSKYASSSDAEKWAILVGLATSQAIMAKRWAAILQDPPAADQIN
jgi:hypothetical protein